MSIADKLTQIAENQQKVYDSGYNGGEAAGYRTGHSVGYVEGETAGFDAGKQAEREAFWNAYIPDGLAQWQYVFYVRWGENNFYPTKDLKPKGALSFGFSSFGVVNLTQRLKDCGVTLDTSGVTAGNYMFAFSSKITHLPTLSFVGLTEDVSNIFDGDKSIVEIEKIILKDDGSTTFSKWFRECYALTTIAFEGVIGQNIDFSACTKLSKASITNIINHLSDTVSGKTLTLSQTAVWDAFTYIWVDPETGEEHDMGYSTSDEWNALEASKPNWTITLV